jgi:hypothetical protein
MSRGPSDQASKNILSVNVSGIQTFSDQEADCASVVGYRAE